MTTTTPKTCHCAAYNSDECICGAWDDLEPIRLRDQLAAAQPTERVCRWIMSANGYTTTECGYIVQSNERRACPYCGGKIIEEVRT